ncbi:hypothetical protein GCM10025864_40770 [Luteimicrobium album]|uniref:Uncharacterized protein n=1 Tax=Luteimicrobium album TaxID=1054550 RepID=A0ABQ6I8N2_9MICO|nr:hypothetical protein GCM10025864_40770 [Luteimicrobium album]
MVATGVGPVGLAARDGATARAVPRTNAEKATDPHDAETVRRLGAARTARRRGGTVGPARAVTVRAEATAGAAATSRSAGPVRAPDRSTDEATATVAPRMAGATDRRGGVTTRVAARVAARVRATLAGAARGATAAVPVTSAAGRRGRRTGAGESRGAAAGLSGIARATSGVTVVATDEARTAATGGTAEGTKTAADRALVARARAAANVGRTRGASVVRSTRTAGRDARPACPPTHETTVEPTAVARGGSSTGRVVRVSVAATTDRAGTGRAGKPAAGTRVRTVAPRTTVAPRPIGVRLTAGADPARTATTARRASPVRLVPSRTVLVLPSCRTT